MPKVTRAQIQEVVRKEILRWDLLRRDFIPAIYRVRCAGGDINDEAHKLAEAMYDDWDGYIPIAWSAITVAGLVDVRNPETLHNYAIEKFWQFQVFTELLEPTFALLLSEAKRSREPCRGDFNLVMTDDGCDVVDQVGNMVVRCRRVDGAMAVSEHALSARDVIEFLDRERFVSHHHLLEMVVSAFLCLPGSFHYFQRYPNHKKPFVISKDRVYLCVPFHEKKRVKEAGAKFDWEEKAWYIDSNLVADEAFLPWVPHFDIKPDPLPETTWFSNVRSEVTPGDWEVLKKVAFNKSGYRCESCGGRGQHWPVECHEVWEFNENTGIQRLSRMTAICPPCHEVVHLGLANCRGRAELALEHMARVTNREYDECVRIANHAIETTQRRSRRKWTLDLNFLDSLGVSYHGSPGKTA